MSTWPTVPYGSLSCSKASSRGILAQNHQNTVTTPCHSKIEILQANRNGSREIQIRVERGWATIANLTAATNSAIDDNVKHFAKIPYLSTVRVSRRMMAICDAEQMEVRYPRVSDMFPSAFGSGSEVHSRRLHHHEPCAHGLIAKIIGPRVAVGRTAHDPSVDQQAR